MEEERPNQVFWVPHRQHLWLPGLPRGRGRFDTELGQVMVAKDAQLEEITDRRFLEGVDDLSSLPTADPVPVLHTVRTRYRRGDIYTRVSPDFLVAVNPFKAVPAQSTSPDWQSKAVGSGAGPVLAHPSGTCAEALRGLLQAPRQDQAILISGDSGAGKTEVAKSVIQHASEAFARPLGGGLEEVVLAVSPVLEAFGNAATPRNPNSSRLGTWLELRLDPAKRKMLGAKVVPFLFEASRVCGTFRSKRPQDLNFHIFRQLLAADVAGDRWRLGRKAAMGVANGASPGRRSLRTSRSGNLDVGNAVRRRSLVSAGDEGFVDAQRLSSLRRALTRLGFSEEEREGVFQVAAAVLHLGDPALAQELPEAQEGEAVPKLEAAAGLLGLDEAALSSACRAAGVGAVGTDAIASLLYSRLFGYIVAKCNQAVAVKAFKVKAAGTQPQSPQPAQSPQSPQPPSHQTTAKRGSWFSGMFSFGRTGSDAELRRSSTVMNGEASSPPSPSLDDFVAGVPENESKPKPSKPKAVQTEPSERFFGVLDPPGVEALQSASSLEQFLMNSASERQQQLLLDAVFKHEIAQCSAEDVHLEAVFMDNSDVLSLLQGSPTDGGILGLLEGVCTASAGDANADAAFAAKAADAKVQNPMNFTDTQGELQFGIKHYSGEVVYSTDGFVERNLIRKPPQEVLAVLATSKHPIVQVMAQEENGNGFADGPAEQTRSRTLQQTLSRVEGRVQTAQRHFICCILPNKDQVPDRLNSIFVMEQLKLSGVLDATVFRRTCYPMRQSWEAFTKRYLPVVPPGLTEAILQEQADAEAEATQGGADAETVKKVGIRRLADVMLEALQGGAKGLRLGEGDLFHGKTKLVLRAGPYRVLEERRALADAKPVSRIQAAWRGLCTRRSMRVVRQVDQGLKECLSAGPGVGGSQAVATTATTAEALALVEASASQYEIACRKAMGLPVALPRLKEAARTEARLRTEAEVMRRLAELQRNSEKVQQMYAAIAHAANFGIKECPLVESLRERAEAVKAQKKPERKLKTALALDDIEELREALAKLPELGLDQPEKWLLKDGPQLLSQAKGRLSMLEEGIRKAAASKAEVLQKLQEHMTSTDLQAIQEVLVRATQQRVQGEELDSLAERRETLEAQYELLKSLRRCLAETETSSIEKILQSVSDAGFGEGGEGTWLLPDGPKAFKEAQGHLEHVVEEQEKGKMELSGMDRELQSMAFESQDVSAMEDLLTRAKQGDARKELVQKLETRCNTVRVQTTHRKALLSCQAMDRADKINPILEAAAAEGLDNPKTWLLVDGGKVYARAKARAEGLRALSEIKERINNAAKVFDAAELEAAINEATVLGMLQSEYTKSYRIYTKLQNPFQVRGLLKENKGNPEAEANLQKQLNRLEGSDTKAADNSLERELQALLNSSDANAFQAVLKRVEFASFTGPLVDKVKERLEEVQQQTPILTALKESGLAVKPADVEKALQTATNAGLGEDGLWVLPEGPKAFRDAEAHLQYLRQHQQSGEGAPRDARSQLGEMMTAVDPVAIDAFLGRLELQKAADGPEVEGLRSRLLRLQQETQLRNDLRQCIGFEEIDDVLAVLDTAAADGKEGSPETDAQAVAGVEVAGWILPDGPKAYDLAHARLKELEKRREEMQGAIDELSRHMHSLLETTDVEQMEAALAKAAAFKMKVDVVTKLERRADRLKRQQNHLRALKHCEMLEDEWEISGILANLREAGLHEPWNWLWPEGPKLFSMAVMRQDFCHNGKLLQAQAEEASRCCNAPALGEAVHGMEELGLPAYVYKDASNLFVDLHNGAFVEAKLKDLQDRALQSGKDGKHAADADSAQAMANLAAQLQRLGLGKATPVSTKGEVRKRPSLLGSSNKASERAVGLQVFLDLSNFSQLRDPLNWGTGGAVLWGRAERAKGIWDAALSASAKDRVRAMLSHQTEYLCEPLTLLKGSRALERAAVKAFRDVLRFMGDRPCIQMPSEASGAVLAAVRQDKLLRDEIYVQILKQLTGNPSAESAEKGWLLLLNVVKQGPEPSWELNEFLQAFLQKAEAGWSSASQAPEEELARAAASLANKDMPADMAGPPNGKIGLSSSRERVLAEKVLEAKLGLS